MNLDPRKVWSINCIGPDGLSATGRQRSQCLIDYEAHTMKVCKAFSVTASSSPGLAYRANRLAIGRAESGQHTLPEAQWWHQCELGRWTHPEVGFHHRRRRLGDACSRRTACLLSRLGWQSVCSRSQDRPAGVKGVHPSGQRLRQGQGPNHARNHRQQADRRHPGRGDCRWWSGRQDACLRQEHRCTPLGHPT